MHIDFQMRYTTHPLKVLLNMYTQGPVAQLVRASDS